MEIEIMMENYF